LDDLGFGFDLIRDISLSITSFLDVFGFLKASTDFSALI